MIRLSLGPGVFPDVCAATDGDGWWVTWQDDQHRVLLARVRPGETSVWLHRAYEHGSDLAFPRANGHGVVAYRGGDSRLYVNGAPLGTAEIGGNRPILISLLYAYAQHAPTNGIYRYPLAGGAPEGPVAFGAGTGLSRLDAHGAVRLWDDDVAAVPGLTSPSWSGDDTVAGELPGGGVLVRSTRARRYEARVSDGEPTHDPRLAVAGAWFAVAYWRPVRIAPGVDRAEAWLAILEENELAPVEAPPPFKLPPGTVVDDVRGWMLGDLNAGRWPRTGTHQMTPVVQDRSVYWGKFGELPRSAEGWPHWERWGWTTDDVVHLEDHSDWASYAWDASDRRWMPRTWAVGDSFIVDTWQRNYDADGRQTFERPFRYEMTCEALVQHFVCGGDIGTADVLIVRYDPRLGERLREDGSRPGHYERFYFARGWGWFRWEAWRTPAAGEADTLEHVSVFDRIGGRLVQPGAGVIPAEWWTTTPPPSEPPSDPPKEPPVTDRPPVTDYETFLNECEAVEMALVTALSAEHGRPTRPSVRDLGHNAWRRLVERWDFEPLVNAIYTERGQVGPFPIDAPPSDPPATAPRRLVGQLRRDGDHFVDDTGPVLPVLCHFGEAFSAFTRGRDRDVLAQLEAIAAAGYHGVRVWSTLPSDDGSRPGTFWRGRSVNEQDTPDYWPQLRAFLASVRARGLTVHLSLGDWLSVRDPAAYAARLVDTIRAVGPEVVALFEGLNEARDTGNGDVQSMAAFVRRVRDHVPVLCGLSAYTGTEEVAVLDTWSREPADLFLVHGYRGGRWWDKVRHIFSLQYEGRPARRLGWQGEPTGPGPEVSVTEARHELEDPTLGPARLSAMALLALMTRQAWVYMSGAGVLFNRPVIDEVGCRAVAQAAALLPRDVMTYQRLVHGGDTWHAQRIFAAWNDVRCDHALHDDGRFVCLLYGPEDVRGAQPVRACTIEADHVLSPEVRLVIGRV